MLRDEELFPDAEAFIPERYEAKVPEDVQRRMNPRQCVRFITFPALDKILIP